MIRGALLLILLGALTACSHDPGPGQGNKGSTSEPGRCVEQNWQIRWQAETAPVITKRQGQEALDSYDADAAEGPRPCP